MSRTWFSYVVLAVGLMMLMASDKSTTAEDLKSLQEVNIFINKDGDEDAEVKLVIDGNNYNFSMPELADGEEKVISTEDGTEITIKSISGDKMIWIDGKEMHLPSFGKHKMDAQGLSAMIGRSHKMMGQMNEIVILGDSLEDDVKAAIIDAVKGVLTSYDVDKKVKFGDAMAGLHIIKEGFMPGDMHKFDIEIETDDSEHGEHEKVIVIKKEINEN